MRLEEMKESNDNWTFWIIVIIETKIIFFAPVISALWKPYRRVEDRYYEVWGRTERRYTDTWQYTDWRSKSPGYS